MSAEDARIVRALVMGAAVGACFWLGSYAVARAVLDRIAGR